MKKLIFVISIITTFTGCLEKPLNTTTEGQGVEVQLLFEKDGIKVYRFWDGGSVHYFTDRGETMTTRIHGKQREEENISEN